MATKTRRIAITAGIALVLVILAAWKWIGATSEVRYRTAAVERGDVDVTVSATGNPNAVVTVQVGSQVSGNVQALFNTKVAKDQLIA
jgi:HlyD family secretion protein